jgi:hypothetical protein
MQELQIKLHVAEIKRWMLMNKPDLSAEEQARLLLANSLMNSLREEVNKLDEVLSGAVYDD